MFIFGLLPVLLVREAVYAISGSCIRSKINSGAGTCPVVGTYGSRCHKDVHGHLNAVTSIYQWAEVGSGQDRDPQELPSHGWEVWEGITGGIGKGWQTRSSLLKIWNPLIRDSVSFWSFFKTLTSCFGTNDLWVWRSQEAISLFNCAFLKNPYWPVFF